MSRDGSDPPPPQQPPNSVLWAFAGLGTELAGGIAFFVLIGYGIDRYFGTAPVWVVTLAIVGCVGGMYHLIMRSIRMQRRLYPPSWKGPPRTNDADERATDREED